jgi:hypothetical protein
MCGLPEHAYFVSCVCLLLYCLLVPPACAVHHYNLGGCDLVVVQPCVVNKLDLNCLESVSLGWSTAVELL